MSVVISDEVLHSARMSVKELLQEIAITLFEKEKLTLGQASGLAEMSQYQFQHLLASRGVALHYGLQEFEEDLETLCEAERI
jgi:predicted HTH domain antitoxin